MRARLTWCIGVVDWTSAAGQVNISVALKVELTASLKHNALRDF